MRFKSRSSHEVTSTCVKVHLSDLVVERQKRVGVRQVHGQREREQGHENKRQARVLKHCGKKKKHHRV